MFNNCHVYLVQMSGSRIAALVQANFSIALALFVAIYHQWKLGLLGATFVPFVLVGALYQAKIIASHDNLEREGIEESSKVKDHVKQFNQNSCCMILRLMSLLHTYIFNTFFFSLVQYYYCLAAHVCVSGVFFSEFSS